MLVFIILNQTWLGDWKCMWSVKTHQLSLKGSWQPGVIVGVHPLSLALHFNGHFPGKLGLAGGFWSKGWRRTWWWQLDYWSYKLFKAPVKSSPPSSFLQVGCPSWHLTNSVKALKGKISHSMDLLTPSSPGGLPTLSLTT